MSNKTRGDIPMKRSRFAVAALAALFCISAGTKDDAAKAEKKGIQGTWRFVSVLDQGQEQAWPEGNRLVITSEVMQITYLRDDPMGWKYTIDSSKDPKEMDWIVEIDPAHPIRQLAIYSLDGDTLKICSVAAGKPRPAKLASKKGDFGGLWVLKRAAPAQARQVVK